MSTRERRQLATQKLASWGVQVQPGADRESLEGTISFTGRVVAPVTANNIRRATFVVRGEALRFTDAPLDVLGEMTFFDVEDLTALEKRIQSALERRMMPVVVHDSRLKDLRVLTAMDAQRLVSLATISVGPVKVDLEVDPEGVRIARVVPPKSQPLDVPRSFPRVPVQDFQSLGDLELYLSSVVPKAVSAASVAARDDVEDATDIFDGGSGTLEPLAAPAGVPTLKALLQKFGDHAVPSRIELVAVYQVGKKRFRLVAHHDSGTVFKARLIDADAPDARGLWAGEIDLAQTNSVDDVVASVIGVGTLPQPGQRPAQERRAPAGRDAGFSQVKTAPEPQILPRAGEVWVMRVVVERDDGKNVRYVCVDADERPYGEPRVLPRPDFAQVFGRAPDGSFRLCVLVEEVKSGHVSYRQMDASRVPGGDVVRIPVAHLAAAFVPEASLY